MTLTMHFRGRLSSQDYQLYTAYMCTELDNCSFSRYRDTIGVPKI